MIIDKNGKLFGKLNIIDLAVILVIIAAAAGICVRFVSTAADNVRSKTDFTYVVEIEGVRLCTVEALERKGLVTDTKTKNVIGEITDVEYQPMKTQSMKSDGTTVFAEVPDRYTALVTVKSEGSESDKGYFVGENIELSVGTTMTMATKYVNSSGKVKSIL